VDLARRRIGCAGCSTACEDRRASFGGELALCACSGRTRTLRQAHGQANGRSTPRRNANQRTVIENPGGCGRAACGRPPADSRCAPHDSGHARQTRARRDPRRAGRVSRLPAPNRGLQPFGFQFKPGAAAGIATHRRRRRGAPSLAAFCCTGLQARGRRRLYLGGDARGARGRALGHPAGAGDRSNSRRGRGSASGLRRQGLRSFIPRSPPRSGES